MNKCVWYCWIVYTDGINQSFQTNTNKVRETEITIETVIHDHVQPGSELPRVKVKKTP